MSSDKGNIPKLQAQENWTTDLLAEVAAFEALEMSVEEVRHELLGRGADPGALLAQHEGLFGSSALAESATQDEPTGTLVPSGNEVLIVCQPARALDEIFRPLVREAAVASAEPGGAIQVCDDDGLVHLTTREFVDEAVGESYLEVLVRTREAALSEAVATLVIRAAGEVVVKEPIPLRRGVGTARIPLDPIEVDPESVYLELVVRGQSPAGSAQR
ncbi:hypothetical protein ACFL51_00235 [Myxococcota bacterium]